MAEAALKSSAAGLKPGVVTGEDYKTLVDACKSGGYALPAVNVSSSNTVNGVLEAAAKNKSDIIIQLSNGGAQFYAGQGFPDGTLAKVLGAVSAARHVHMMAEHYGVCVVLHTDHANKKLIPWVEAMLDHGEAFFKETGKPLFSSHMLDLSEEPIEWNLNECARVLSRMAPMGMSLEIELGVTGGEEDGIGGEFDESADNSKLYTQPEDVLQAYEKLESVGMFSVAASFGNVHGVYKPGNVKLRPEVLADGQKVAAAKLGLPADSKPFDYVFHGGSGSLKSEIEEALRYGVVKMNVDTDMQYAFTRQIAGHMFTNYDGVLKIDGEVGNKKAYDPRSYLKKAEASMSERVVEACTDLHSAGRSVTA